MKNFDDLPNTTKRAITRFRDPFGVPKDEMKSLLWEVDDNDGEELSDWLEELVIETEINGLRRYVFDEVGFSQE